MSLSSKRWAPYADHHPFIKYWCELETISRLYNFVAGLTGPTVHPGAWPPLLDDIVKPPLVLNCSRRPSRF